MLIPRELHESDRPSTTAQWTIAGRALELDRRPAHRIVSDEFAPVFLSPGHRAALLPLRMMRSVLRRAERLPPAGLATSALCRHAFIDAHLRAALDDGCAQVLVLGAGYDTRAHRFADELGGRPVFEADLPPLSRRKAEIVAAHPELFGATPVRRVEIDFRTQALTDALPAAGFVPGRRTFVVWEGVSMYLTPAAVRHTLYALHALCGKGSVLAMDAWQRVPGHRPYDELRRAGERAVRLVGEPLEFATPAATIDRHLARAGFEVADLAEADELTARHATDGRRCDAALYLVAARRR